MDRNSSSSLRRALALLDEVAAATPDGGATLGQLAASVEVHKSSVLRLLAPMADAALVRVDSGRYRLGPRAAQLGAVYLAALDLRAVAHPLLEELVDATGETVYLVLPDLPEMVYVDKIDGPGRVRMASSIGSRQPAHSTGVGKAYLAFAGDEAVDLVVGHGMPARTEQTVTDPRRFRAELCRVRDRGYAVDDVENEADIRCVAAPIVDHAGSVTAALSVAGLATRITPERYEHLGGLAVRTARAVSAALGAPDPKIIGALRAEDG
ncbi:IclR family transcriptional regulator [Haloactinopolyspora alba]|uniref:IclR family transcriptional regulator n=1 Tax=Haloactinopolyspora alba TaxID=648780 RepID=UPI00197AC987|nr:IclR family transcriptional regulator [Haloactinopolyspora alba]